MKMKKDVYYCIVLSDSQLDFLAGSKYGIDRMKVLKCLIDAVVIKPFSAIPHISFRILEDTKQFFGRQLFRIRKVSYYHIKCFDRNGIYPHSQ